MKNKKRLLVVIVIVLAVCRIAAVNLYVGDLSGQCCMLVELLTVLVAFKYPLREHTKVWMLYLATMLLGFLFHLFVPDIQFYSNFKEVLGWVTLIWLLLASRCINSKVLTAVCLCIFVANSGIGFVERLQGVRFIEYEGEILEGFTTAGDLDDTQFRSFSLLGHPLTNACITSIFMGFVLVSNRLNAVLKYMLLAIGLLGLFGFNSRGAMLVWFVVLLYRFALYNKSFWKTASMLIVVAIVLPFVVDYINTGVLGRFSFDFSDDSSSTRWMSYVFFGMQDWNVDTALFGGNYIKMPGTDLLLENGVLLNLSYWGWLVGALKTILEFLVTYQVIKDRPKQEIFIILLSFWGVALTNNIIAGVLPLTYFLLAYAALGKTDTPALNTK